MPIATIVTICSPMHMSHEKWNVAVLNMDSIIQKYASNVPNENVPSFLNNLATNPNNIYMYSVNHGTFEFSSFHVTS